MADRHMSLHRLSEVYKNLKAAHDAWQPVDAEKPGYWNYYTRSRGRTALWNDLEVWEFDRRLALYPTELARIDSQLTQTAPFVDKQIMFQYPGFMCHPDNPFKVGGERAMTLYEAYAGYRDEVIKS